MHPCQPRDKFMQSQITVLILLTSIKTVNILFLNSSLRWITCLYKPIYTSTKALGRKGYLTAMYTSHLTENCTTASSLVTWNFFMASYLEEGSLGIALQQMTAWVHWESRTPPARPFTAFTRVHSALALLSAAVSHHTTNTHSSRQLPAPNNVLKKGALCDNLKRKLLQRRDYWKQGNKLTARVKPLS